MTRSADMGTGATFIYAGDTTFTAKVLSMSFTGYNRGEIDTTHMESTDVMTRIPQDLEDAGGVDMEIAFDETVDTRAVLKDDPGSLSITYPIHSGDTVGATLVGTGAWTSFESTHPQDDKSTSTCHWEWDGKLGTPDYEAGS